MRRGRQALVFVIATSIVADCSPQIHTSSSTPISRRVGRLRRRPPEHEAIGQITTQWRSPWAEERFVPQDQDTDNFLERSIVRTRADLELWRSIIIQTTGITPPNWDRVEFVSAQRLIRVCGAPAMACYVSRSRRIYIDQTASAGIVTEPILRTNSESGYTCNFFRGRRLLPEDTRGHLYVHEASHIPGQIRDTDNPYGRTLEQAEAVARQYVIDFGIITRSPRTGIPLIAYQISTYFPDSFPVEDRSGEPDRHLNEMLEGVNNRTIDPLDMRMAHHLVVALFGIYGTLNDVVTQLHERSIHALLNNIRTNPRATREGLRRLEQAILRSISQGQNGFDRTVFDRLPLGTDIQRINVSHNGSEYVEQVSHLFDGGLQREMTAYEIDYYDGPHTTFIVSGNAKYLIFSGVQGPYDRFGRFDPQDMRYAYELGLGIVENQDGSKTLTLFDGVLQPSVRLTLEYPGNIGRLSMPVLLFGFVGCLRSRTEIQIDSEVIFRIINDAIARIMTEVGRRNE